MNERTVGSMRTHKKQRQRFRRELEAVGMSPKEVARRVEKLRREQLAMRADAGRGDRTAAATRARWEEETYGRLSLDDSKHKPARVDSVLTGAARATGATAKAVKRTKALTRTEWAALEREGR